MPLGNLSDKTVYSRGENGGIETFSGGLQSDRNIGSLLYGNIKQRVD